MGLLTKASSATATIRWNATTARRERLVKAPAFRERGPVKTANGTQAPSLLATEEGGVQILKTVYTNESDIIPNEFIVKKGKPVRLEIQVKEQGFGCMGSIYIPGLTENPQILNKRQTIVFEFTPEKSGNYPITCAMGVPRGSITVS